MFSPNTLIKISDQQASTVQDNEAVILNFDKGEYFKLDAVGAFIWQKLHLHPQTFDDLSMAIQDSFEVEKAVCEQDLNSFLENLWQQGLIVIE